MSHFHLVHLFPSERHHEMLAFNEVIDSLSWGLQALGHHVTTARNSFVNDATNIIIGHHVASADILAMMPPGSIIYNLVPLGPDELPADSPLRFIARNFQIWDYLEGNMEQWAKLEPLHPVVRVPIGYAPTLTRIPKAQPQDIDVLICGHPSGNRIKAFQNLTSQGLRLVFAHNFYGKARDDLISRSKIMLLIGDPGQPFDIKQAVYLMANRKAVLAELYEDVTIEGDLANGVMFIGFDFVLSATLHLLDHDDVRSRLEDVAFLTVQHRIVTNILAEHLGTGQ